MSNSHTRYYIDSEAGKFFRENVSIEDLGPCDAIIQKVAEHGARKLTNLASVDGIALTISVKGNNLTVGGSLKAINIKSPIEVIGGVIVPKFNGPRETMTDLPWTVPDHMDLRFIVQMELVRAMWKPSVAYMTAASPSAKGWFRLPLSNTYEDGKLCLGNGDPLHPAPVASDAWKMALDVFNSSPFNTDLQAYANMSHCHKMFSWDAQMKQLPVDAAWSSYCVKINNPIFDLV